MPTSPAGSSALGPSDPAGALQSGERGFTLVELLAVVAILAFAAIIAGVSIHSRRGDDAGAEAAAHALAARLRAAREAAIQDAGEEVVLIDTARRIIASRRAIRPFSVAPHVHIEVVASRTEEAGPGTTGIRFFPNGASTGGVVRLSEETKTYEVRVNWLTGRVSITGP